MNLDLKLVQYVVCDEADRLFEMGFETALNEIIHRLPASRQTLLFSATLPKSLVDFAKAGLQDPKLIRLDAESKISSDLKMAFFSVKPTEKDACLLSLLRDVIKVPFASAQPLRSEATSEGSKSHTSKNMGQFPASSHQTVIFTATKHHVEYLLTLLTTAGYAASHIYSSLDQSARMLQMDQFRRGFTSILVVTDIAARGIDIPVLENVINFDFPHGSRVFVHRVGRTARAGRQGWAWSFVTQTELPYLLDLQLFLARPLRNQVSGDGDQSYTDSLIVGTFQREQIDEDLEYVRALDEENHALSTLREVMRRGHAMYERSKGKASHASYKTAKEMVVEGRWLLAGVDSGVHPVLLRGVGGQVMRAHEEKRKELLKVVSSFRPNETAFEIGKRGEAGSAALMRERRKALTKAVGRAGVLKEPEEKEVPEEGDERVEMEIADEAYIAVCVSPDRWSSSDMFLHQTVFDTSNKTNQYRDPKFYMSYDQKDAATDKGCAHALLTYSRCL
jgi:ATP-dependent RNA helicase DDX54/DBP10